MERNEIPLFCFTTLQDTGELILVKQYEKDYEKDAVVLDGEDLVQNEIFDRNKSKNALGIER